MTLEKSYLKAMNTEMRHTMATHVFVIQKRNFYFNPRKFCTNDKRL